MTDTPFPLAAISLAGTNLIEAGAGTGKTYTIAGLYIRLLIESGVPVKNILVVTYTVAATEELKDRIRRRIREMFDAVRRGTSQDMLLETLIRKFPLAEQRREAEERLAAAIRDFDQAAIYTIHGFCQRVLQENAFASGTLFDAELITDDQEIRREIVEDFWRTHFYGEFPEVAAYAIRRNFGPDFLLRLVTGCAAHPDVRILPEFAPVDRDHLRTLIDDLRRGFTTLGEWWRTSRGEVCRRLSDPSLKATMYGSNRVQGWAAEMDAYLSQDRPSFPLFDQFDRFTADRIASAVKRGHRPPEHPLFETCQEMWDRAGRLTEEIDRHLLFLQAELVRTVRRELPRRKQRLNVLYFDDLLLRLREALDKPGGEVLAGVIRKRYRAALIDEFQDTDPVQYAIFSTLFRTDDGILFLIGDPKQAIYRFRGADIFAYLKAALQVDTVYTLRENWRSDPALVEAVNALFTQREHPFVFQEIAFRTAQAGTLPLREPLLIDGRAEPPFHWWFVAAGRFTDGMKPLSKGIARPLIARSVAAEIARLIRLGREGRAILGGKPLREGDIAILVRTNREAHLCCEILKASSVPAVLHSTGSIFDSNEALEMERVLLAALSPERHDLLQAALATDMIGCNLAELDALRRDERTWESWQERFRSYHETWGQGCFLTMFRMLLDRERVRPRLLSFQDGERRLTNLLHLTEVLHRQSCENTFSMTGLLKGLSEQRKAPSQKNDEHQLRLESDARAVRIVTIHKSKGLEYPIVFIPFSWGDSPGGDAVLTYHDPQSREQICDLGSDDRAGMRAIAAQEALAEEVRLLYVALTRARNRCTFVWGSINDTEMSAQAYLFHGRRSEAASGASAVNRFRELTDEEMFSDLGTIALRAGGAIELKEIPVESGSAAAAEIPGEDALLSCRKLRGEIDRSWRMASFSLLSARQTGNTELPDHDEDRSNFATPNVPEPGEETQEAIFSLPGGRRTGSLLHEILQRMDFQEKDETVLDDLIAAKLREKGFEQTWAFAIQMLIRRILKHPLGLPSNDREHRSLKTTEATDTDTIILSAIPFVERLNELEFTYPLKLLSRDKLIGLFREAGLRAGPERQRRRVHEEEREILDLPMYVESLKRLRFDPIRGFMKGFIDMVFRHQGRYYLVDWKSNFLGRSQEDYHRDRLTAHMAEYDYILQYHLYTLALDRYLSLRQPGYDYRTHFGGVYYLFLRGMNPAWGRRYGVFQERPAAELVEFLCGELIGRG